MPACLKSSISCMSAAHRNGFDNLSRSVDNSIRNFVFRIWNGSRRSSRGATATRTVRNIWPITAVLANSVFQARPITAVLANSAFQPLTNHSGLSKFNISISVQSQRSSKHLASLGSRKFSVTVLGTVIQYF
jgi:hypothetical protein